MTLRTLKTLHAHSLLSSLFSRTLETLCMYFRKCRESIIGSWERCAHSLVSAGMNSRTFEILLAVMNCEPFFFFVLDLFWGHPNSMSPKSVYQLQNRPGSGPDFTGRFSNRYILNPNKNWGNYAWMEVDIFRIKTKFIFLNLYFLNVSHGI